ncbi:MAG: 16S rRNA (adenine(1518)-N(6)/adenine(1519)-N(6))-dimethyltransferase RsmA [Gemmatimonadales bacterium]
MARKLGQHFLTDPAILDRIVAALDPAPQDTVIEIGAGKGSLSRRLAPKVGRVIAIEKDRDLAERLREAERDRRETAEQQRETRPPLPPNVSIVEGDALELDWHSLLKESDASRFPLPVSRPFAGFKLAGNIPYQITSPLIDKALTPPAPERIVFLVQLEVAARLAAEPGSPSYGPLTVGVQSAATVERLFTVKAGSFSPPPKVHSALVRLTPLEDPLVPWEQHAAFRRFVHELFSRRRKQLGGVLKAISGASATEVAALAEDLKLDLRSRAEVFAPVELARLFMRLG